MSVLSKQIEEMFALQDKLNSVVSDNWRANDNCWSRAIWTECAEMMEHYGWKWWKKQDCDIEQVKLEIVDIWHFVISWWMQHGLNSRDCTGVIDSLEYLNDERDIDVRSDIENIAARALSGRIDSTTSALFQLINSIGMSTDELYQWYVGKNVLNQFRQDHGYKTGEYQKIWNDQEDNVHLANIIDDVYQNAPNNFSDALYNQLTLLYPQ